jgi:hypothetical protein
MPTYTFINNNTGEEVDVLMKISEKENFLKENPHLQLILKAPSIVSGVSISTQNKIPEGFKEVLSKVSDAHPNSEVAKKHRRRSIKEVKTDNVVKKHVEKITGVKI